MHRARTLVVLGAAAVIASDRPSHHRCASAQAGADELLTGLNSPKGVAMFGRDVVVAQGAFGPPGSGPAVHHHRPRPRRRDPGHRSGHPRRRRDQPARRHRLGDRRRRATVASSSCTSWPTARSSRCSTCAAVPGGRSRPVRPGRQPDGVERVRPDHRTERRRARRRCRRQRPHPGHARRGCLDGRPVRRRDDVDRPPRRSGPSAGDRRRGRADVRDVRAQRRHLRR